MSDKDNATSTQVDEVDETLAATETDEIVEESAEVQETNAEDETDETESESQVEEDDESDDDALVPLSKLRKVRNEAKSLRDRLRASEARVAELESGSGDTALTQERDDLKAQLQAVTEKYHDSMLSRLVRDASNEAGAIDPEVIAALVKRDAVTWEDDNPTNVKELVADLKKKHPKLFGSVLANGNGGNRNERAPENPDLKGAARIAQGMRNQA